MMEVCGDRQYDITMLRPMQACPAHLCVDLSFGTRTKKCITGIHHNTTQVPTAITEPYHGLVTRAICGPSQDDDEMDELALTNECVNDLGKVEMV